MVWAESVEIVKTDLPCLGVTEIRPSWSDLVHITVDGRERLRRGTGHGTSVLAKIKQTDKFGARLAPSG